MTNNTKGIIKRSGIVLMILNLITFLPYFLGTLVLEDDHTMIYWLVGLLTVLIGLVVLTVACMLIIFPLVNYIIGRNILPTVFVENGNNYEDRYY